jgi:hypothetical protein
LKIFTIIRGMVLLTACLSCLGVLTAAELPDERTVLFYGRGQALRQKYRVLTVADPGQGTTVFPPRGKAYRDDPAAWKLWRMLVTEHVDLVLTDNTALKTALENHELGGFGSIPVMPLGSRVPDRLPKSKAHAEFDRHAARTPAELVEALRKSKYGMEFPDAVYVPGMSLIARMRIGESAAIRELALPFAQGSKDSLRVTWSLPNSRSGSQRNLSGGTWWFVQRTSASSTEETPCASRCRSTRK